MNLKVKLGLIAIIIFICLYHFFIQNKLEKLFFTPFYISHADFYRKFKM